MVKPISTFFAERFLGRTPRVLIDEFDDDPISFCSNFDNIRALLDLADEFYRDEEDRPLLRREWKALADLEDLRDSSIPEGDPEAAHGSLDDIVKKSAHPEIAKTIEEIKTKAPWWATA